MTVALFWMPSPLTVSSVGTRLERVVTVIVKTALAPTARSLLRVQVTLPPKPLMSWPLATQPALAETYFTSADRLSTTLKPVLALGP